MRLFPAVVAGFAIVCAVGVSCAPAPSSEGEGEGDAAEGEGEGEGDVGEGEGEGEPYGANPGRCGIAPYTWRDASEVGGVLEGEETSSFSEIILELAVNDLEGNGEILLNHTVDYGVKVHRIRYQTQDRGELVDATGLIGVPDLESAEQLPILLFLHGTVGIADICSPSLDPTFGGDTYESALVLGLLASFGYVVVAPDYLGLKSLGAPSDRLHSYLVGEPTAIASLDMVRAAKAYVPTVEASLTFGPLVVDGASQGGHAAAFVTRFQPHYAPDLPITAAVYGIPPTDLAAHMNIALRSLSDPTSNAVAFGLGAEDWYRASPNGVSSFFDVPYDADLPPYARTECGLDILDGVPALDALFTDEILAAAVPGVEASGYAPWDCYLRENTLATTSVPRLDDTPAMFVIGSADTLVDPGVERAAFTALCGQGYDMQFVECEGAGHAQGFLYSLDDQFDFLEARIAGAPMPADACTLTAPVVCSSQPPP